MISLRPYQQESFQALISYFETHAAGNPTLILPCGAGKSVLIGKIAEYALQFENQKILVASHIKELLQQDAEKFHALQPDIPFGMYCAGLGKKQLGNKVTFCSVQSSYKNPIKFGFINLFILDEAHLLSDNDTGMYRQLLKGLWEINPKMRLIGLTATGWRTRIGLLTEGEGALFTDTAYEISLKRLIEEGWICRTIGKQAKTQGDTSSVDIRAGEFVMKQCETIFDEQLLVSAAIKEMIECGANRKTWLIFCTSVKHAEHVAAEMNAAGIPTKAVSEKTSPVERAGIIRDLKNGSLRAATNVSVLTTGTDIPNIDMTVFLRPTDSPGLFLQMAGRGFRLSEGKQDHLLLDLAGNLIRHGPLTHISSPEIIESRKKKKENLGKVCPNCESVCQSHAKECLDCGYEFPPQPRVISHSERGHYYDPMSNDPILSEEKAEWFNVKKIYYVKHFKTTMDGPPSMCVTYETSAYTFKDWLCPEHTGYARQKFVSWWLNSTDEPTPDTVDAAIEMCRNGFLEKVEDKIYVKKDGKYPRILQRSFIDRFEKQFPADSIDENFRGGKSESENESDWLF